MQRNNSPSERWYLLATLGSDQVAIVQSLSHACDSIDCTTSGFSALHHLPEFAQTHAHWVGDAIQPSHPLSSLFLLPLIFPSIRGFSNESLLPSRGPNYQSFSFNISPSNECLGLISFRIDWFDLFASKGLSRVFSNTTVQNNQFFGTQLSW